MPIVVGTSGWQYRDWRGPLYPPDLPQHDWLAYYASRYATVENNSTFYRLPARDTFRRLAGENPRRFRYDDQGEPVPHPHQAAAGPG